VTDAGVAAGAGAVGGSPLEDAQAADIGAPHRLYVGSYTASSGGSGAGITVLERTAPGQPWQSVQTVEADDPSFLVATEGALHAVSETTEGRVLSYTISAGRLVAASSAASGGSAPCHVLFDPASGALVVANYVGGTVAVLSSDPSLTSRAAHVVALPVGHGPVQERQERPHAHQASTTPWGTLLVSDLGTDRLVEVAVDPVTLVPEIVGVHLLPAGAGPRHVAWLGDRLVVAGELDARLHVLQRVGEKLVVDHSVEVFEGSSSASGVFPSHLAVDGGRVYVATRGREDADARRRRTPAAGRRGALRRHLAAPLRDHARRDVRREPGLGHRGRAAPRPRDRSPRRAPRRLHPRQPRLHPPRLTLPRGFPPHMPTGAAGSAPRYREIPLSEPTRSASAARRAWLARSTRRSAGRVGAQRARLRSSATTSSTEARPGREPASPPEATDASSNCAGVK
jgi:6-phosphogluconolactonase